MSKYFKILSAALLLSVGNFATYSSDLIDKDERGQSTYSTPIRIDDTVPASKAVAVHSTASVTTLYNYLLCGACVLISQV